MYEALEGAGLTTAAINITTYRGRNRHLSPIPGFPPVHGPKRFFFYSVYESDRTGAPIAFLNRSLGSIDAYAATIGRWLVTRDGFDLLVHYLPDYDYASHALGPDAAHEALAPGGRRDRRALRRRRRPRRVPRALRASSSAPTTGRPRSSRRRGSRCPARSSPPRTAPRCSTATTRARLAEALDGEPSVDVALFLEDGEVVARGATATRTSRSSTSTRTAARAPRPRSGTRTRARCSSPRRPAGSSTDLAGRHHLGGGSHGALAAGDSEVPMLTVGLGEPPASITGIKGLAARALRSRASPKRAWREPQPAWIDRQLVRRGIHDERVLAAMARVPRELFVPAGATATSAYDDAPDPAPVRPDDLAAVHGRAHLPRRSGSTATSGCSTSAPARATRRPCSPSSQREVHTIERIPELADDARAALAAAGYERVQRARRRRSARPPRARAVRRDRGRGGGAARCRRRSGTSCGRAAGSSLPLRTGRRGQNLCVLERTPAGPRLLATRSCALRSARQHGDEPMPNTPPGCPC